MSWSHPINFHTYLGIIWVHPEAVCRVTHSESKSQSPLTRIFTDTWVHWDLKVILVWIPSPKQPCAHHSRLQRHTSCRFTAKFSPLLPQLRPKALGLRICPQGSWTNPSKMQELISPILFSHTYFFQMREPLYQYPAPFQVPSHIILLPLRLLVFSTPPGSWP